MSDYQFTEYFEKDVLRKRPYLKKEWCIQIIENPLKVEPQEHNRFRYWGVIDELEGVFCGLLLWKINEPFIMLFQTEDLSYETQLSS